MSVSGLSRVSARRLSASGMAQTGREQPLPENLPAMRLHADEPRDVRQLEQRDRRHRLHGNITKKGTGRCFTVCSPPLWRSPETCTSRTHVGGSNGRPRGAGLHREEASVGGARKTGSGARDSEARREAASDKRRKRGLTKARDSSNVVRVPRSPSEKMCEVFAASDDASSVSASQKGRRKDTCLRKRAAHAARAPRASNVRGVRYLILS